MTLTGTYFCQFYAIVDASKGGHRIHERATIWFYAKLAHCVSGASLAVIAVG